MSGSSKPRKRSEVLRSTLGTYLKQRNYMPTEKFRKSELTLTQTVKQAEFGMMLEDDVSKVNSFLFSNVMCLNNNAGLVDQQFAKFLEFVRAHQQPDVKQELQAFVSPLICHLFIDLLKGKDPSSAHDFLHKFAPLVGPVVVVTDGGTQTPAAHTNGTTGTLPAAPTAGGGGAASAAASFAVRRITFVPEPENAKNSLQTHFMSLVEALSCCQRTDDVDNAEVTRLFRYAQYELTVSWATVVALKRHLIGHGHVMILHTLQTWFAMDVIDDDGQRAAPNDDDDEVLQAAGAGRAIPKTDSGPVNATAKKRTAATTKKSAIAKSLSTSASAPSAKYRTRSESSFTRRLRIPSALRPTPQQPQATSSSTTAKIDSPSTVADAGGSASSKDAMLLEEMSNRQQMEMFTHLRWTALQVRTQVPPMRVLTVNNADRQLTSASVDPTECHLAGGFADSTVRLWPLRQSFHSGRKPYGNFIGQQCEWSMEYGACDLSDISDITSSDDDDDDDDRQPGKDAVDRVLRNRRLQKRTASGSTNCGAAENDGGDGGDEKNCFDSGERILRGHSGGVTGVLFSRQQTRLLFSVSKDRHMRAWLADSYGAAAIYRGHQYAVWCLAESSIDTYLATGSRDLTARLWNTEREFPLHTYVGHTQDVDTIAFHPNGNYLATGSTDQTVRLWCVTSGKLLRVFHDSHLPVQCLAFSPDGKLLAVGGEETKIRILDLAAGAQLAELRDHSAAVTSVTWSSAGNRLVSGCADGSMRIFDVAQLSTPNITASSTTASVAAARNSGGTSSTTNHNSSSSSNSIIKAHSVLASGCDRCVHTTLAAGCGIVWCIGTSSDRCMGD